MVYAVIGHRLVVLGVGVLWRHRHHGLAGSRVVAHCLWLMFCAVERLSGRLGRLECVSTLNARATN